MTTRRLDGASASESPLYQTRCRVDVSGAEQSIFKLLSNFLTGAELLLTYGSQGCANDMKQAVGLRDDNRSLTQGVAIG